MTGWRFAFSRRWLGYLAFAVIFAVACGCLSAWQLARSKEAAHANALVSTNFNATPVPLTEALPSTGAYSPKQEWKRVTATGTYLAGDQLLVRNRPLNGSPGFEVLVPLKLADGSLFIVDRGWVPTGSRQDAPDSVPAPPAGQVTVIVRLKAGEPSLPGRSATGNEVATIELPLIQKRIGGTVYTGAYGILASETPHPALSPTPVDDTAPTADEGLHWSYMIQWIIFALIGFFGLGYALRQEYRRLNEDDPAERERAVARERKRAERTPTDAEAEDELLERSSR